MGGAFLSASTWLKALSSSSWICCSVSGLGAPHYEGGSGSVEPLVLVEADNFGGPLVFVAVSAGHPGHSGGLVGSMSGSSGKTKLCLN